MGNYFIYVFFLMFLRKDVLQDDDFEDKLSVQDDKFLDK